MKTSRVIKQVFHTFAGQQLTITPLVLWITGCTVALGCWPAVSGNNASGRPQHRGGDSFDCCPERYEIVVYCLMVPYSV